MIQTTLALPPRGRGLHDITGEVKRAVSASGVRTGTCSLFVRHTSASLVVQENADPAVLRDLQRFVERMAPEEGDYEHEEEGPDDMPAHLRSSLTSTSETIPVTDGQLSLGTWQAIYLWEHRRSPHRREVALTILGE